MENSGTKTLVTFRQQAVLGSVRNSSVTRSACLDVPHPSSRTLSYAAATLAVKDTAVLDFEQPDAAHFMSSGEHHEKGRCTTLSYRQNYSTQFKLFISADDITLYPADKSIYHRYVRAEADRTHRGEHCLQTFTGGLEFPYRSWN